MQKRIGLREKGALWDEEKSWTLESSERRHDGSGQGDENAWDAKCKIIGDQLGHVATCWSREWEIDQTIKKEERAWGCLNCYQRKWGRKEEKNGWKGTSETVVDQTDGAVRENFRRLREAKTCRVGKTWS